MDKIYADPNMENDNTEHFRGKRLSSILKAPRNPLDDLGNGNELTQDINIEKRRKNSRRVSFANTINCRVFHQDLKNNTSETESTEREADTRNDILLNQNEALEAVPCEITGMNTLLHAPIQASVQQTEWHDRPDTTVIFSDENEMDMTSSHTAVITRNLQNNQADKTEKIDIVSFLAGLNSNNEKTEMSKEFHFFSDPTNHSCPSFEQKEEAIPVKKINFNEFLMSMKSNEKVLNPPEGSEKENVCFVPSQASEGLARSSVEFVCSREPLDTCNITKIFRGQDDGMEMTQCQAAEVKARFSGICEAPPEQLLPVDVTEAFVDDGMDMTTSHTAKMSCPFPSLYTDKANVEDRRDPTVLRTVEQEARTTSAIPGSISSETVFRGEKTVISLEDMDLTKACVVQDDGKNVESESPAGAFTSVACKPHFLGNRSTSANLNDQEEMEMTKCHAVVIDDQRNMEKENLEVINIDGNIKRSQAIEMNTKGLERIVVDKKLGKANLQASGPSSCANSMCSLQEQKREAPENIVTDTCAFMSLQSQKVVISQPLEKNLPNISVSCANDKTGRFSGDENMDITKTHPAAFDISPANTVQEYENNCNQNHVMSKQLQSQTFQFSGGSGVDITGQTAARERGDLKINIDKQTVTPLAPSGSLVSSNEPVPSRMKGNEQLETIWGIKANCQTSDRQGEACTMKGVNKMLSTRRDSERDFSIGKTVPSEEDTKNPHPVGGLHLRGPEEPVLASTAGPHTGRSQLPSFLEKSVVFPSGENMDLTGNCAVMVPDHNINEVLAERKAVPGYLVQDENKVMSLKKGVTGTTSSQEQPVCNMYSSVSGKKMLTMTGLKHLPFPDEKTRIFSDDADMDITRSHTVSSENKVVLQCKSPNDAVSLNSGDRTCVFTYNDDMEITRLDTVAIDKSMEKAASQGMLNTARQAGRKSLKGTRGEKTVLFSVSDEDNDMEITESHTAAIGHEIVSQNEAGSHSVSSAHPVKTVMFTSTQADMDVTESCSADKTTGKVVRDDKLHVDQKVGQQALPNSEATVFAMDDMEITKTHSAALEENSRQGRQPAQSVPLNSTVMFTSYQADMEITEAHSVAESTERDLGEERLKLAKQVGQEAVSESKTVIFTLAEDMEITKTHTAVLRGKIDVQDRESVQAIPAVPADKTVVFTHSQGDMEITASHTTAVNNNMSGFENQEVSHKSTQQPDLHSALLSSCGDEIDSQHAEDLNGEYRTKSRDKPSVPSSASSASASPSEKGPVKVPSGTPPDSIYSASLPKETMDVQEPQGLDLPTDNSVPVNSEQDLIPPENLESKRVSFKLPSDSPMVCSEESGDLVSCVSLPIQQSDSLKGAPGVPSTQGTHVLKDGSSRHEGLATDSGLAGASLVPVSNKESEENEGLSAEGNRKPSRQDFSPSQFIAEEFLPVYLEEMDSNESVSSELMENACSEISKKQIFPNEKNQSEETKTCKSTKRALGQDEEDLQSPKKLKRDENLDGEASQDLQVTFGAVSQSQAEVHEGADPPYLSAKSSDCTHASTSTSSSLDSVKADTELTSEFCVQRTSQVESRLLTDSICEDNLREKFETGVITVGEFLTLLQVHVPIQKPRRSHLPANCAVSTPPTPEDLMYSQYIYRPKLRIYEEDCQALSQKIDELKVYVDMQDQLLVNVNRSLWEVMRTCSDEELQSFGAELNKMKSCFSKESKIMAHNEKATLYSKLLQSTQEQQEKLQSRMEKLDELIKEAESCLVSLETDSDWEDWEADSNDEIAEGKTLKEALESVQAEEEELQRELSDLETQSEQMLAEMSQLQEEEKNCWEIVERYNFMEWEITEWSEQRAVFSFLYDSIELTVVFGPPIDGDVFGEDPSRKIVSLDFESLLDEENAPPSSRLVQRLIFQFIESWGCWQEKCPTLNYLPQVLHDVSSVVSRCKVLGEEIEFLERWGGKFNLLKVDINDTKVKLLFSASMAFAKFELTLSLAANYPSAPLPFTVRKQIGNIGEEEIAAVLSNVPVGYHYLRRT
ncbi:PREDICTED: protein CASC5, partial [Pterocles gutturalis]|uniref:protein CASC5 n=1 Tax=Pterocles gutturalis TaxID=240206 RepID=UPI000528252B